MTFFLIDGLRYHFQETGSGEPLILLHGFTGSTESWSEIVAHFGNRFHVIAIDLPGHGCTESPGDISRYRIERVGTDLVNMLDSLCMTPAHWLGYSMGGRLALYITLSFPQAVRSLILESASPGIAGTIGRESRRAQDEALADRIETEGVPAFIDQWERQPLFASQTHLPGEVRADLHNQRLRNSAKGLANSLRGMGSGVQPSFWDQLGAIERSVLLLAGSRDDKFVAINLQMADRIPGAQLHLIPNAGHTIHLEQPQIFSETVLNFLLRRLEGDGQNLTDAEKYYEDQ